jgi:hypothetical protein
MNVGLVIMHILPSFSRVLDSWIFRCPFLEHRCKIPYLMFHLLYGVHLMRVIDMLYLFCYLYEHFEKFQHDESINLETMLKIHSN